MFALSIPSPPQGVWYLGPVPLRAYALCILIGIGVAFYVGYQRYKMRGGDPEILYDIALIAVPLGIVGARTYHVLANADYYFSDQATTFEFLKIWQGGLGIWGGVIFGIGGVWIGARHFNVKLIHLLDALAPGVLYAQAIGRLGNWFNQELYGFPTDKPWGLEIDPQHMPLQYPPGTLFHPTFLYELVLNLCFATLLIVLDKKLSLWAGQVTSMYVMFYGVSRLITEHFRIDPTHIWLGLRLHTWFTLAMVTVGVILFFYFRSRKIPQHVTQVNNTQTDSGTGVSGDEDHTPTTHATKDPDSTTMPDAGN